MSHIATVDVQIKDLKCLKKVCEKMNVPVKIAPEGQTLTENMYGSQRATGHASFKPKTFTYPVVVDKDEGTARFDTFPRGRIEEFYKVQQEYSAALSTKELISRGYTVQRTQKQDGSIELTCTA